jgi:hypothetical protein
MHQPQAAKSISQAAILARAREGKTAPTIEDF